MTYFIRSCFALNLILVSPLAIGDTKCDKATSTVEIRECLSTDYKKHDKILNANYKTLYSMLPDKGKSLLKRAQKSWLQYRENECEMASFQYYGGTLSLVTLDLCYVEMTEKRAKELSNYIDSFNNI